MTGTENPASTKDTKVEKPNREEFDKLVKGLEEKIQANKDIVEDVKKKLDHINQSKEKGEKEVDPEEKKLKELKAVTQKVNETRKELFEQQKKNKAIRDQLRDQFDQTRKTFKDLDCPSLEHLEKKIRELEYHLTTNSLTLREEKQVLSDIKGLNSSKKMFSELENVRAAKERADAQGKEISQKLDVAKAEFEKAKAEEDAQFALVTSKREKKSNVRSEVPALLAKRNTAKEDINKLYDELKQARAEFQKKENAFRKYQNERYKELKEKRQAEFEQRKQEQKIRQLEKDEEKFENLHSNEFASIDQLISYLNKYLADNQDEKEEDSKASAAPTKLPEGATLIGKAARGFDDDIFGTKAKGKAAPAKKQAKKKTTTLVHDLHFLQEFQTLKVEAPLTLDAIPTAVERLNARKSELQKDKETQRANFLARKAEAEKSGTTAAGETETSAPSEAAAAPAEPATATA
eukprot:c2598_g1_i1.p1 GENE.c2598_g1_i1~~c2598_g1_i1.p1  ORF type:complete len:480 (+),score=142.98 c2598_g1_i1:52-1440(+)